ncbi:MAG: hypothetical protein AAGI66_08800 [Cyanobacteria bacterium P01_H01_bin.74]
MFIVNTFSKFAQGFSDNITHVNYLARSAARTPTMPENRQMDYFWRDGIMAVGTIYAFNISYALVDTFYNNPEATRRLGLHKLAECYIDQCLKNKYPAIPDNALKQDDMLQKILTPARQKKLSEVYNFSALPPELESFGYRDLSDSYMPERLEIKLNKTEAGMTARNKLLVQHLYRKLNYPDYLARYQQAALKALKLQKNDIETIIKTVYDQINPPIDSQSEPFRFFKPSSWFKQLYKNNRAEIARLDNTSFQRSIKSHFENKLPQWLPKHLKQAGLKQQTLFKKLIVDGLKSKRTVASLQHLKGSGTVPSLMATMGILFLSYGLLANWADFHVILPWQKKVSEKLGGVSQLMGSAYAGLAPWAATFLALKSGPLRLEKLMPKASSFKRSLVEAAVGLSVLGSATYGLVKRKLNQLLTTQNKAIAQKKEVDSRPRPVSYPGYPVYTGLPSFYSPSMSYSSYSSLPSSPFPSHSPQNWNAPASNPSDKIRKI